MNYSAQPISALPLSPAIGSTDLTPSSFQQALSIKPSLGIEAAGKSMMLDPSTGPLSALNPLKPELNPLNPVFTPLTGVKTHSDAELRKVSQKFESIFIQMMFKEMRETVHKSSLFGNSQAMQFFETMQDEQTSEHLAAAGGIGLGNVIYQRLKQVTDPHLKIFS